MADLDNTLSPCLQLLTDVVSVKEAEMALYERQLSVLDTGLDNFGDGLKKLRAVLVKAKFKLSKPKSSSVPSARDWETVEQFARHVGMSGRSAREFLKRKGKLGEHYHYKPGGRSYVVHREAALNLFLAAGMDVDSTSKTTPVLTSQEVTERIPTVQSEVTDLDAFKASVARKRGGLS